jgi:hypothetical protein
MKAPKPITLAFLRHVVQPGKYYDADGLILIVEAGGAKRWIQRLTILGKRQDIGLGSALTITPATARRMAAKNKAIARAGCNPLDQSADARAPAREPRVVTLAGFALNLYRSRRATGANLKTAKQDYRYIKTYVTPRLGRRPIAEITAEEIRAALAVVFAESAITGEAVRGRLMQLFDHAVERQLRADNPARAAEARPAPRVKRQTSEGDARNARIFQELPRFLAALETSNRRPTLLRLVRFTLLTARNPMECRLTPWSQIDEAGRLWRFPRMQRDGAPKVEVPLHDGLMEIIRQSKLLQRGDGGGWLFPNSIDFDQPFSMHAALHVPKELGFELVMRDFARIYDWRRAEMGAGYGLEAWWGELSRKSL